MKAEKQIDRSAQGAKEVIMTDIPKSGFNLTYNNYTGGLVLGRLIPMAFQWLMPNDKFSGSNQHMLTFEQLATPVLSDVNVSMHNFYCTLRAVDKDLPMLLTPTKLNNMSAAGSTPRFDVGVTMKSIIRTYFSGVRKSSATGNQHVVFTTSGTGASALVKPKVRDLRYFLTNSTSTSPYLDSNLRAALAKSYCDDVVDDLIEKANVILNAWFSASNATTARSLCRQFIRTIVDFFLGQGSMADYFGYPIINHAIADQFADAIYDQLGAALGDNNWDDFIDEDFALSAPMVNEYPLRIMYTIWLEYYRNFDIEPLTNDTPDYHTWGSTPLPLDTLVQLLVMRPRCWSVDAFISAGVDDISRHIFAPILNESMSSVTSVSPTASGGDYDVSPISDKWSGFEASYVALDGTTKYVDVPLPTGVLSAFVTGDGTFDAFGLEHYATFRCFG